MLNKTPWYDDAQILTQVNDIIFSAESDADTVLEKLRSIDLSLDSLEEEAQLLTLWLKRFPGHEAWGKACANIIEHHAIAGIDDDNVTGLQSGINWVWMDAVYAALPYARDKLRQAWEHEAVVPFWMVYRGYSSTSSLAAVPESKWQSFASGLRSLDVPRQVLFDIAEKCWGIAEFGPGTNGRGLLAHTIYVRGAHLYHDRMTLASLGKLTIDAHTRRFLYWGLAATALDYDGKVVRMDASLIDQLCTLEAKTLFDVMAREFDLYSGESVPDMDDEDVERVEEKMLAPWKVLLDHQVDGNTPVKDMISTCFPQLTPALTDVVVNTKNAPIIYQTLGEKLKPQ